MAYVNSGAHRSVKRRKKWPFIIFALMLIIGLAIYYLRRIQPVERTSPTVTPAVNNEPASKEPEQLAIKPLPSVQKLVERWTAKNSGTYSVVVHDLATDTQLASYEADRPYFTASIYKLYVAYLGYIDIQDSKHALNDPFLGVWNRQQCLDKMIRESHSPCAEKLWAEQGKETSTSRLKKFGLTGTSLVGLTTTAHDSNIILTRLYSSKDLSDKHTKLLFESMKKQIYRDAIPKAVPGLVVADKVGFRELVEYHDTGFVILPGQRQVAITIFTENAGTRRIIDLTRQIFAPLINASE